MLSESWEVQVTLSVFVGIRSRDVASFKRGKRCGDFGDVVDAEIAP